MKKSVVYPEWAEKFRGKERTIRKVRDGYGLYQCTSVYQPGQKYPKSVQKYLGMITEKDGFIPKPLYFDETYDDLTGELIYKYKGNYWDMRNNHQFENLPKIF